MGQTRTQENSQGTKYIKYFNLTRQALNSIFQLILYFFLISPLKQYSVTIVPIKSVVEIPCKINIELLFNLHEICK